MDLGIYLRKNRTSGSRVPDRGKYCLNCQKKMEKNDSHLYFQGFCSQTCKDEYLESFHKE